MKKSLLALAVLSAVAGAASAQSSVTLSGRVDAGVVRNNGQWSLGGSQSGYNSFTLSGNEDLGGGMRAFFALNHRFGINSGATNVTGTNGFWRNSWVGLGGAFGDVRMGRILMPLQDMNGGYDAFDTGYVGSTHTGGILATIRATNAIYYRSPSMGGLFVHAAIAAGEGQLTGECQFNVGVAINCGVGAFSERPVGFGVGYGAGPIRLGFAYDKNGVEQKTTGLYAGYNMGFANLMFQYEKGDRSATLEVDRWSVSAKVPLGAVTFKAGYLSASDEDFKKFGLGLQYDLSKRTNFYTNMGKQSGNGTVMGATAAARNTSKKAKFDVGVSHAF
jgi:predicted porin